MSFSINVSSCAAFCYVARVEGNLSAPMGLSWCLADAALPPSIVHLSHDQCSFHMLASPASPNIAFLITNRSEKRQR